MSCLFFLFLLRFLLPPGSTLFPYTTLFRSRVCGLRVRREASVRREVLPVERRLDSLEQRAKAAFDREYLTANGRDRKSTRLNSSHLGISYAVFCLKKKKKNKAK